MLTEAYQTKFSIGHQFAENEKKFLSLNLGNNFMMYAISTENFNNVFELAHVEFSPSSNQTYKEKLNFFLQNFSLSSQKFEKVNVAVLNAEFTILPEAYKLDLEEKSYLTFSTGNLQLKNTFHHRILDFRFCYGMDAELLSDLEKVFSHASIRHAGAVNLHLFFNHFSLQNSDVFLALGDSCMEIMIKKQNKLIFYNVYKYSSNEDVLYYLLFAVEQYELNPLTVKLAIASQLGIQSDLHKTISKYIKQVLYAVVGSPVKTHKDISKLPQHYYFTLLNQHLCEL